MVWTGNTFSDKGQCVVKAVLLSRNQSPCCSTHRQHSNLEPGHLPALPERAGAHGGRASVTPAHSIPGVTCGPVTATPAPLCLLPLFSISLCSPAASHSLQLSQVPGCRCLCSSAPLQSGFSPLPALVASSQPHQVPPLAQPVPHAPHMLSWSSTD